MTIHNTTTASDLVVLVAAVAEVEAGDVHARAQQVAQHGHVARLGAKRADDLT